MVFVLIPYIIANMWWKAEYKSAQYISNTNVFIYLLEIVKQKWAYNDKDDRHISAFIHVPLYWPYLNIYSQTNLI